MRRLLIASACVAVALAAAVSCVPSTSDSMARKPRPTTTVAATTTTAAPTTTTGTSVPSPGGMVESFDTAFAFFGQFQTEVYNAAEPPEVQTWQGDHDLACEGPTTYRTIHQSVHSELIYWCAPDGTPASGHVMTSMLTSGFGDVNFAPARTFTNITRVCWSQNLTDEGGGRWTNMVVVPEATYQANGAHLNYVDPENQDPASSDRGTPLTSGVFLLQILGGSTKVYAGRTLVADVAGGFVTQDKMQRFPICATDLGNGSTRLDVSTPEGVQTRTVAAALPDGQVRVVFQDVVYDPDKHIGDPDTRPAFPFTWHWDNIVVDS